MRFDLRFFGGKIELSSWTGLLVPLFYFNCAKQPSGKRVGCFLLLCNKKQIDAPARGLAVWPKNKLPIDHC